MNNITNLFRDKLYSIFWYVGGFFILGLGVNLMKASNFGAGAWDTVTINARAYINNILDVHWVTLGMLSLTVSLILFIIVTLYRKSKKYFFMLIPIFLVAVFIDFWNIFVFKDVLMNTLIFKLLFYTFGSFTLPLGLAMIVKSSFPAFVFDELMLMLVKITKASKIVWVRLGIELTGILIGSIFGYLTFYRVDGTLGAVNIGSIIIAFSLAPILQMWYKVLRVKHD
jgi:uncharacterized membrane protein YczE